MGNVPGFKIRKLGGVQWPIKMGKNPESQNLSLALQPSFLNVVRSDVATVYIGR